MRGAHRYKWKPSDSLATILTDCEGQAAGSGAGNPYIVSSAGVMMFAYGTGSSWYTIMTATSAITSVTGSDAAVATPVWLPSALVAYMVGYHPSVLTLNRYSSVSGALAVALENNDQPTPYFYESDSGDGVAVIGGQVFFPASSTSGGVLNRVYATQTSSFPIVVDPSLSVDQVRVRGASVHCSIASQPRVVVPNVRRRWWACLLRQSQMLATCLSSSQPVLAP